jgi:hypothetical protein
MQPASNSAAYALMHALDAVIACMHTQSQTHGWEGFSRREADSAREHLIYDAARIREMLHDDIVRGDA